MLKAVVDRTFNLISVDNCMSTSDCVFVLANGQSGVKLSGRLVEDFMAGLEFVCRYLAKEIARDGEGATKLFVAKVLGARDEGDARKVAKALIRNDLLKAAVYGKDRNVGRILAAVGATDAKVDWDKFKFTWKMGRKEDIIAVDLAAGNASLEAWGCDLTEGYIKINAAYCT
jgi:glutamate N-acetyltransferase/amino-acid N-acetyltransferase